MAQEKWPDDTFENSISSAKKMYHYKKVLPGKDMEGSPYGETDRYNVQEYIMETRKGIQEDKSLIKKRGVGRTIDDILRKKGN